MPLSEHAYCACCIQNNWVQQWICIKFHIKLHRNYSDDSEVCRYRQPVTGSFITTMCPFMPHMWYSFWVEHQITQVTQFPCSPGLMPCNFCLFPKLKSPLKGRDFRVLIWGSWWQLRELHEVPRCLLQRGLKHHCPMYGVLCFLYLQ